MSRIAGNRQGAAPRSIVYLLVLLALGSGALIWIQGRGSSSDFTLGGPLFPVDAQQVEGFLLTGGGQQNRLDRTPQGVWTLGGAVTDYVDSLRAEDLVAFLTQAQGGPVLAGSEPEDRRYEFNGSSALRLTIFVKDADPISLAIGAANPVNGMFYGSGAGREQCFLVTAGLRQRLGAFPGSIQAMSLLPGLDYEKAEGVALRRGFRESLLERVEGRWWILLTAEGPGLLGPAVRDYQAQYSDRRFTDERGTWVLASEATVREMIYDSSEIIIRKILSPGEGAQVIDQWDLTSPWRRVEVRGKGLNPDPTAPNPDVMTIAFGAPLGEDVVPALRRGNVLLTDFESLTTLEKPLGALAHTTALTFLAMRADEMVLKREGSLLLRGDKSGEQQTLEGRKLWRTLFPGEGLGVLSEKDRHGLTQNLMVELDRLVVLAVLPPARERAILAETERVVFELTFGSGDSARRESFEIGYLDTSRLSAGAVPPVITGERDRPVALWVPETGQLLQIPVDVLVTARNMASLSRPVIPE